jgi:hypothetical protein
LRRLLDRHPKDRFWGLKALAERQREPADLIDEAYDVRNDLFHAEPGRLEELAERTRPVGDRLEALVPIGILLVLDLADDVERLPEVASSNHPTRLAFRGRLRGDPRVWGERLHPHVDATFEMGGVGERGRAKAKGSFTVKNADSIDFPSIELRGPFGPHVGSVEFETASIVTAEGTVNEDVKPD